MKRSFKAFTLVELLVVIAIIGILISILLPTLGSVRRQANTVACGAQLRSMGQMFQSYIADNKGSCPWGYRFQAMSTAMTGAAAAPTTGWNYQGYTWYNRYQWTSQINAYGAKDKFGGLWPAEGPTTWTLDNFMPQLSKIFLCPDALASDPQMTNFIHNHYGFNMVVMPNASYECDATKPNFYNGMYNSTSIAAVGSQAGTGKNPDTSVGTIIAPAKLSQLFPDTAVVWDCQQMVPPDGYFYQFNVQGGAPWSGVSGGMLEQPTQPIYRYRAQKWDGTPETLGSNSIWYPTKATEAEYYAKPWTNADSYDGVYFTYWFPSPRFRHQKNTVCNVLFADGSVRPLKLNQNKVSYTDSYGDTMSQCEFTNDMCRIKRLGTPKACVN